MNFFWLFVAGVAGGVLGGMGFGGGTLLIPILTFFLGLPYPLASWVNLVAFLPMATVAILIHYKNKMLEGKAILELLIFAVFGVFIGALVGGRLSESMMCKVFGVFLISVGSISFFAVLFGYFKRKRKQ